MPISLSFANPTAISGAYLPPSQPLSQVIQGIPNLVGTWLPSDYQNGAIATVVPKYGATILTATGTVNKGTVENRPAFTFDANASALIGSWAAAGSPYSALFSFYVRDASFDFQNFFGPNGAPRLLFRRASGGASGGSIQWAASTNISGIPLTPPIIGWHTAEIYGSATQTRLIIDGVGRDIAQAGNNNAILRFGASPAAGDRSSVAIGAMLACNSNIFQTEAADAAKAFLF